MKSWQILKQLESYGKDDFQKVRNLTISQLESYCEVFYIENLWHLESFLKQKLSRNSSHISECFSYSILRVKKLKIKERVGDEKN